MNSAYLSAAGARRAKVPRWCVVIALMGLVSCRRHVTSSTIAAVVEDSRALTVGRAIVDVCSGSNYSCALDQEGNVACWGDNWGGQVPGHELQVHAPRVLGDLPKAKALYCNLSDPCVQTTQGQIACRYSDKVSVLPIPGRVQEYLSGESVSCAILEDHRTVCSHDSDRHRWIAVDAAAGAMRFAPWNPKPHDEGICILKEQGAPVCIHLSAWAFEYHDNPEIPPPAKFIDIASDFAGATELYHDGALCGRFADGRAQCRPGKGPRAAAWIESSGSQLLAISPWDACLRDAQGKVSCLPTKGEPIIPDGVPRDTIKLALAEDHACALTPRGVECWGQASHGQLGDGTSYLHSVPTRVPGVVDATGLAINNGIACAVTANGAVTCWGSAAQRDWAPFPGHTPVTWMPPEASTSVMIDADGQICTQGTTAWWCLTGGSWSQQVLPSKRNDTLTRLVGNIRSYSPDALCGIDDQGAIWCTDCSPPHGAAPTKASLVRIADAEPFVQVASYHMDTSGLGPTICARTDAGRMRCYRSRGGAGECGQTSAFQRIDETSLDHLTDIVQIKSATTYGDHAATLVCALSRSGLVYCFGHGDHGQLGTRHSGWRDAALPVPGLPSAVEIGVGGSFACARTNTGHVYCWGLNRRGQVPDGAPGVRREPVAIHWPR